MAAAMICADTTICGCVESAGTPEWILARQSVTMQLMQTAYSPSVLVYPGTNALENTKLFHCLVKILQTLQVGLISTAVVVNCERDVRTCASHPLIHTAFNLDHSVSDDQPSDGARHLPLSELTQERIVGMA